MTIVPLSGGKWQQALDAEWRFVKNLYGSPGVNAACVKVQDNLGVDVIVLLHSAWLLCREDRLVDSKTISVLDSTVSPWRMQIVHPLRSLRRLLKLAACQVPESEVRYTRQLIAQAEIGAERAALAQLAQLSSDIVIPAANGALSAELISRVVGFYSQDLFLINALQNNELRAAIETLQKAIDRMRQSQQNA